MSSSSQGLSLVTKIIFVVSLLILFVWVIPTITSYYQNVSDYDLKQHTLEEVSVKHNIEERAEVFSIEAFREEALALFKDVKIESNQNSGYDLTVQVDKNKMKSFNTFIETLPLRYLVVVKNTELKLEEKEQLVEVKLVLEEL